jgi:hypothetical protein
MRYDEVGCPHCGFEAGLAPLTTAARRKATACPLCDRAPFADVTKNTLNKSLGRMEQENPQLFDYLIEKMERKAARRRISRWVGVVVIGALLVLIAYLLVRYLL